MTDLLVRTLCFAKKHTSPELPSEEFESNVKRICDILAYVIGASTTARKQGLLALEEYGNSIVAENNPEKAFFKEGIEYIVDGTDPEFVREILGANIIVNGVSSFTSYLKYLCLEGILSVQAGENPRIIEKKLLACLTENVQERAREAMEKEKEKVEEEYFTIRSKKSERTEKKETEDTNGLFSMEELLHLFDEEDK